MRFTPQTEEEINSFKLLPDGEYDFTVVYAEDKVSEKGNEYIFLKLQVWDFDGRERLIFTNLAFIKLLKHFCDITGLQDKYQHGEIFAADCLNKMGRCILKIQQGNKKPDGSYYPDKNVVEDYIIKKPSTIQQIQDDNFDTGDIPF
jgi:Protein of unknown function (DUF669)